MVIGVKFHSGIRSLIYCIGQKLRVVLFKMSGCFDCLKSGKPKSDCIEYGSDRCHNDYWSSGDRLLTTVPTSSLEGPNDGRIWARVSIGEGDVTKTVAVRRQGV